MNKALFFFCFFLSGLILTGQKKNVHPYYLIEVDTHLISQFDKHMLDSIMPIYHKTNKRDLKLSALKTLSGFLSDPALWIQYNELALNETQNKNDSSSIIVCADALNNLGYYQQMVKNNIKEAEKQYHLAYLKYEQIKDYDAMSGILINLAYLYHHNGNVQKSIDAYNKAINTFNKSKNFYGMATAYKNLSEIYIENNEMQKAYEYLLKAKEAADKTPNTNTKINIDLSLGIYHDLKKNYPRAKAYYIKTLAYFLETNNLDLVTLGYTNLASLFLKQNEINKTETELLRALEYAKKINNADIKAKTYQLASDLYEKKNNKALAFQFADSAYFYAKTIGYPNRVLYASKQLSELYGQNSEYKNAYLFLKEAYTMRDSIYNDENKKAALRQQFKLEYQTKESLLKAEREKEKQLAIADKKRQNLILFITIIGIISLLIFLGILYNRFKITQKQKLVILEQKHLVEEKQKEIVDSITYAKRIQTAILPPLTSIQQHIPNTFIFYKPKDIVAGDFYWHEPTETGNLIAAADCTGHGVPGAMVSVLCHGALNRAVREFKLTEPGKILDKTRDLVIEEFEKSNEDVKDGMDISLACFTSINNVMHLLWAGANNPLWLIRNNELMEFKPNKQPIGKFAEPLPFTTQSIPLQKNDTIYLFSDGFADQFGGDSGKKYKAARMKEMLLSIQSLTLNEQKATIENEFNSWMGEYEQLDDVCLIGIRFE